MKLRWWYGIVLNLVLAALVISGAVFYRVNIKNGYGKNETGSILEIRDASSGKVYGKWPISETEEFSIEFVHSVNQSPVRETFRTEGTVIRPVSVHFTSFGAGMRSDLEEGQTLTRDGDFMVISGFSTSFDSLKYIIGTISDHLLYINSQIISLRDLCGRNAHITIRCRRK